MSHICVVTETYPPEINGVALTLAHLVDGLRDRGHRVAVVRPRQSAVDGPGRGDDGDLTLVPGVPVPGYPGVRVGWPAGAVLRGRWTECRPDVVYTATEGPLGWSALRTARRLEIPVLSGFHTNFHDYARHYGIGWLWPLGFRYLRRFHNRTLGTLVASTELSSRLRAVGFENLSVLGRGVDAGVFTPRRRSAALRAAWGAAEGDLVVLHVGRVAPEKNVPLAIAAYREMQRASRSVRCVIVGDGPLRGALQASHPDLRFCGVQIGESLAAHYASADVFLFPSETETFGNVTLEAMASGLAVVAYDYAAAHAHIRHGDTGVLVPYGDHRAFIEAAVALARSPRVGREMGARARAYAAGLDWPSVVERFERLLTSAKEKRDVGIRRGMGVVGGHSRPVRGGGRLAESGHGHLDTAGPSVHARPVPRPVALGESP
jgi:glycosyltransferase involved in cell wall biosynthesis